MSDITSKTIEQASVCLDQMAKRINAASFVCVRYHVGLGWEASAHILNIDARGKTALEAMNGLCATLKARIDQDDNLARTLGVVA